MLQQGAIMSERMESKTPRSVLICEELIHPPLSLWETLIYSNLMDCM